MLSVSAVWVFEEWQPFTTRGWCVDTIALIDDVTFIPKILGREVRSELNTSLFESACPREIPTEN